VKKLVPVVGSLLLMLAVSASLLADAKVPIIGVIGESIFGLDHSGTMKKHGTPPSHETRA
jgi:hypothetical protein